LPQKLRGECRSSSCFAKTGSGQTARSAEHASKDALLVVCFAKTGSPPEERQRQRDVQHGQHRRQQRLPPPKRFD